MKKADVLKFIDAQPILILTTMNGAQPETRALINIRNANIAPHLVGYFCGADRILFITNTHTDKIKQVRENPTATLYAYNNEWAGLMLTGKIMEITDRETIESIWDDSFLHYYPDGRDGGDFSVLEFIPVSFKLYDGKNGFKKTTGNIK